MKLKEMKTWQRKKLLFSIIMILVIAGTFLGLTCSALYRDKTAEDGYWYDALEVPQDLAQKVEEYGADATRVTVGTYIENLKEINLKSCNFRVVFLAWFRWEGDPKLDMAGNFRVYKGFMNKMEYVKDYHEGNMNYQLVRCDATITKNYWTIRFPLESHQLRIYLESNYTVDDVVFVPDTADSGLNQNLSISGFDVIRSATGSYAMEYENAHGDPEVPAGGDLITSEHVTALEINRADAGLYVKCFIALVGTLTWVLITLFICTYHHVDPLAMIPAALFGTVANVMVGANLLPDALQTGLVEFVNLWGVMMILMCAIVIININRVRKKYEDKEFSQQYGRILFYIILVLTLLGNTLLPFCAYMFV
ncbi:ligand-gated ion channel [Christensenella intestinihominis]|uniref:hypothetical protein n=1 Tax=Christensenella intestinihominis TaxID=1851429 RepID=UPI0008377B50|nr:hypothetical protein [Christensenella intestinihominis]